MTVGLGFLLQVHLVSAVSCAEAWGVQPGFVEAVLHQVSP